MYTEVTGRPDRCPTERGGHEQKRTKRSACTTGTHPWDYKIQILNPCRLALIPRMFLKLNPQVPQEKTIL